MENDSCEIRIYDRDFNWVGAVTAAESVQLERDLYGAGKFEVHLRYDKSGASELLRRGNVAVINGDGHKSAVIRDFSIKENRTCAELTVYGETGNGFAKQRRIVPPPGMFGYDRVSGNAETVIKHYIKKHMTEPDDISRKFASIELKEDLMRGTEFPWQARFSVLEEELREICLYGGMGWEIFADVGNKKWIADIVCGTDRTIEQSEVSPVTFRMKYHNVGDYVYSEDFVNFKNVGYIGGAGVDDEQLVYAIGAENEGMDRWETFVDCGNAENVEELKFFGGQKMSAASEVKSLQLNTLPKVFEFGEDYSLGDKVSVFIETIGVKTDAVVTNVKEIWERNTGYRREIRIGGKMPSLMDLFVKK